MRAAVAVAALSIVAALAPAQAARAAVFAPPTTRAIGSPPVGIATGDFNRDGDLDLAAVSALNTDVDVLLGGVGATFGPAADVAWLRNIAVPEIETNPANLTFATQPRATLSAARVVTVSSTGP